MLNEDLHDLDRVAYPSLFRLPSHIKVAKPAGTVSELRALCLEPEVNPLALAAALDSATSEEWRDWESETIRDFVSLPKDEVRCLDKIMATQVGLTNPDVFEDWHLFLPVCSAFNHRRSSFEWLDLPSYMEAAWACIVLRGLNNQTQFGPGVFRFIGSLCIVEGLVYFPWVGGDGLSLCRGDMGEWAKGLVDEDLCKISTELESHWNAQELQELTPSEINEQNPLEVQLAKLVAAQAYIRAQQPRDPSEYGDSK